MEYRILGGLEIEDRDRLVPLRGPRSRALLAHLLLNANEVVPDERLLEDIWAGEPPKSGRAALRVRVSQLRKVLANGDAALLTRPPGYVLRVGSDEVDALRFERLLAEGRKALAAGRAELAAATLRDALGLWRGPALADVAYEPWAQPEIARLEELRRTALEERIEADLALGRHAELVGELEALVAAEPLRERLRGQLMLALYRSGRQADALAVYRAARQALVEELGIEPGRALQDLQGGILRQDLGLETPRPALEPPREPEPPAPARREERKVVTVIVADLGGSAALAEVQDPERAGALLARLTTAVRDELDEVGGRVESVSGGALTAAFGAPVAQEDHVERALQSALAVRRRLSARFGDAVTARIGVDTGEVVVGRPGGGTPTLTGGPVLTAAQLAGAAGPGTILVGERAVAAARGHFESAFLAGKGRRAGAGWPAARSCGRSRSCTRRGSGASARCSSDARARSSSSARRTAARSRTAGRASSPSWETRASARRGSCASSGTASPRRRPSRSAARGAACPTGAGRRTGRSPTSFASSSASSRRTRPPKPGACSATARSSG